MNSLELCEFSFSSRAIIRVSIVLWMTLAEVYNTTSWWRVSRRRFIPFFMIWDWRLILRLLFFSIAHTSNMQHLCFADWWDVLILIPSATFIKFRLHVFAVRLDTCSSRSKFQKFETDSFQKNQELVRRRPKILSTTRVQESPKIGSTIRAYSSSTLYRRQTFLYRTDSDYRAWDVRLQKKKESAFL
jgi:hypothetical protein